MVPSFININRVCKERVFACLFWVQNVPSFRILSGNDDGRDDFQKEACFFGISDIGLI